MFNPLRINPDYQNRVYGLDVFRTIAILIVVMGHGSFLVNEFCPGFPWIPLIDGVELFFVLSGFLIGGIVIKLYESSDNFTLKDLTGFWKRRWFRTLPAYYLILVLNYFLVAKGITKGDIHQFNWMFFFFLHNFNSSFVDFFWESWSLSIEEWFYLLTPLTLLLIHLISNGKIRKQNTILLTILFFIAAPLIYRISISGQEVDPFWYDVKFRKIVLTRLDAIMFGVFFAWLKFYHSNFFLKYKTHFFITGIISIYAVILYGNHPGSLYSKTVYFSLIGLSASFLLPFADSIKNFRTGFGKIISHISITSYSMYLINLGVVAAIIQNNFMPDDGNKMEYGILYLVYWISVVLFSTLLYKFFEKPMMDLREKL